MNAEIARRQAYDDEMNRAAEAIRVYMSERLAKEQEARIAFNQQHYRYLPPNLKNLLEEPPTRYTMYPKGPALSSATSV